MKKSKHLENQKVTWIKNIILIFFLILNSVICFSQDFSFVSNLHYTGIGDVGIRSYASPFFADVDNDNDIDMYVGEYNGIITLFTNDGNGNLVYTGVLQADGSNIDIGTRSSPSFADIDGDNDLDLYIGEWSGNINVFTNDGSGNFSFTGNLQADGSTIDVGYASTPFFSDIDNDNDLDLYVGEKDGNINVFINDGNGNFSFAGNLQADGSNIDVGYYSAPVFADLDDDGDLDLYAGNQSDIRVYTNNGIGNFLYTGILQTDGWNIESEIHCKPIFADIDSDNDLDLYVGILRGTNKFFINDGSGNLSYEGIQQVINSEIDVSSRAQPTFADIDNDNDFDLYIGEYFGKIKVFINDGNENFSSGGYLQANGSAIDLGYESMPNPVFADIDGDNYLDLYVGEESGHICKYTNNGSGSFSYASLLKADGSNIDVGDNSSPIFADIDRDNDLDLYIGEKDGYINVYLNDGSGNFSYAGFLQDNTSDINVGDYSVPSFIDIDGDNDLDLYVGGYNGNINVFVNDGNGNFSSGGILQVDGSNIDIGTFSSPLFVNNNCTINFYIGAGNGTIYVYSGEDTTSPVIISSHTDQIINANVNCEAILPDYISAVLANDNCDTNLDVTQNPIAGITISGATNQVTLTVTDDAGNTDEVTFNVTVEDNTDPSITCVLNQERDANDTHTYTVSGTEFDPTEINDNCGVISIENDFNNQASLAGTQIPEGTTSIVWTVVDNAGNENTCSFDLVVNNYVSVETFRQNGISIYPNPTNGMINFEFVNTNIKKLTISDITGKKIIEKTTIEQKGIIDLSSFLNGIYIISIQTDSELFNVKIVKR